MSLIFNSWQKSAIVFSVVITVWTLLHLLLLFVPVDLSLEFHSSIDDTYFFIEFAPEIWLTLLGIILGTLIIVISIASQSNPKLIDYYLGDYPSLYYIWGITIGGMENIYMQLNLAVNSIFWNNVIFMNVYLILPFAVLGGIPYTFYILSYTKTSNVISKIFQENKKFITLISSKKDSSRLVRTYQHHLLDTINQLDDQLGFVQFKEAKGEIINRFGRSLRHYLRVKSKIKPGYFYVTNNVRHDISFKTLGENLQQIERDRTFYEHKIFRIMVGTYRDLVETGYHDLASQVGNELAKIGMVAHKYNHPKVVDLTLIQFNTLIRIGIKLATKSRDIRAVYNSVYHYSHLIHDFIDKGEKEQVLQWSKYLSYYVKELYKLYATQPHLRFLIDALYKEIQVLLIRISDKVYDTDFQRKILKIFAELRPDDVEYKDLKELKSDGTRLIRIALILHYLESLRDDLADYLLDRLITELTGVRDLTKNDIVHIVVDDCKRINETGPDFWEDTDRGNVNIYYSENKNQVTNFIKLFHDKIAHSREVVNGNGKSTHENGNKSRVTSDAIHFSD